MSEISKEQQYNKTYYSKNKQKILEQMQQKVTCDVCNIVVCKSHLNRHKKTKRCIFANVSVQSLPNDIIELQNKIKALEQKLNL